MTRDEAKKKINIQKSEVYPYGIIDNVDSVIDEIFDSLQNKNCKGCRYGKYGIDSTGVEIECIVNWNCTRGKIDMWESK